MEDIVSMLTGPEIRVVVRCRNRRIALADDYGVQSFDGKSWTKLGWGSVPVRCDCPAARHVLDEARMRDLVAKAQAAGRVMNVTPADCATIQA